MSAPTPQNIVWSDDLTDPIYLDSDLGQPWPNNPQPVWPRTAVRHKMMSGWDPDEDVSIPGMNVVLDLGIHVTDGEVKIAIPILSYEKVEALRAKQGKPIRWTPDGGTTMFRLAWQGGTSFLPEPLGKRVKDYLKLTMLFWVLSKTVTGS